jgi:hypothetical protein
MTIHVPSNLFELGGIADPWPPHLARARRLLVSLWLVMAGRPLPDSEGALAVSRAARKLWDLNVVALSRTGRVTVVTVLFQLRELGVISSFDAVEGGFAVELVKEVTA